MTIVLNVGIEKMFRFHWIAVLSLSVSFFYQSNLVTFAKCPLWVKCIIMKQLISSRSFFYQDWCFKIAFSSSRGWTNLAKVSLIILMKRCDWAAPKELNHRKRKNADKSKIDWQLGLAKALASRQWKVTLRAGFFTIRWTNFFTFSTASCYKKRVL